MHTHFSNRSRRAALLGCVVLANLTFHAPAERSATAADPPDAPAQGPVLHLANGDYAAGSLRDSARAGVLRWQAAAFAEPFAFPVDSVSAIHFPALAAAQKPAGDYCFELAGGDMLFGSLRDLTADQAEIETPRLGRFHVARTSITRVDRLRDRGDLVYLGPNGLSGWKDLRNNNQWREDTGLLETETEGAALFGDFALPARVEIELEISWRVKPDFVLAMGV